MSSKLGFAYPVYVKLCFFDKVRFISPVKVGSLIRLKSKIEQVTLRDDDSVLLRIERIMEIKGTERLAMYAETLSLMYTGEPTN